MFKSTTVVASVAALAMGVAACGGSATVHSSAGAPAASSNAAAANPPSAPASRVVSLSANPSGALMFTTTKLQALPGKVTIHFTNKAPEGHNFTLQDGSGKTIAATPTFTGGTKTLVAHLKPGTYTYFCSVPGHRQSGMQGTLTVK